MTGRVRERPVKPPTDASSSLLLSVTATKHSDEDEQRPPTSDLHLAALTFDTGAYRLGVSGLNADGVLAKSGVYQAAADRLAIGADGETGERIPARGRRPSATALCCGPTALRVTDASRRWCTPPRQLIVNTGNFGRTSSCRRWPLDRRVKIDGSRRPERSL